MAGAALKQPTTLGEFLSWEERQPERHEFVDGRIHGMAGGTGRDGTTYSRGRSPTHWGVP